MPASRPHRGLFIVVEGLDRSGKTTQTELLASRLRDEGVSAKLMKFPDRTTAIGQMIDAYLRSKAELDDRAIHLLFSANRWELAPTIEQTLAEGTTIICDRYAFSGIAFSAAKGLPYAWCRAPDVSLPAPDLTLFFDVSPEAAKARGGFGEERYEKEEMQKRVREIFSVIGKEMGAERWRVIDANGERDAIRGQVWEIVKGLLDETSEERTPLMKLWV